jgi:carboxypeptidase C (cathepsin A)
MIRPGIFLTATAILLPHGLVAQGDAKDTTATKAPPKAEQYVTKRSSVIGGKTVNYTATAGTLILRDKDGEPIASVGYTSYVKQDTKDPATRPITFSYNGGPGSSSVWLHMGALGPRRIVVADAGPTPPPPYRVVDNQYSLLDRTDLVMIDPVGTGVSRALGKKKDKDFWGVDPDIEEVSRFIRQFVTENGRWNSPRYLLGESYGTTRSAGVVDYLQSNTNMSFNGVILVSVALDVQAIFNAPGNDRPFPLFLPTYAITSFYHKVLPSPPSELGPFENEVRAWALGPYATALLKGDDLSDEERAAIADRLHRYTGLSVDYILKANLRVTEPEYTQELLREHGQTVGRLDSRYVGVMFDQLAQNAEYDPQSASISAAYTAAFLDYYHRELNFPTDRKYTILGGEVYEGWDWKHKTPDGDTQPQVNTGPDLAHALKFNPDLRVLVLNGSYDLATPVLATEYMISHLGLPATLRQHVAVKYYDAGHMMYVNENSLRQMKADVGAFIDATDRLSGGS